ncbi:hypothetical protein EZV62_011236 [Acer yangbiense]|uniref:C2 domain-containing protein n=1 Tax=Acer yangbiense TaxID=1000413 RepID=A0A5C7I6P9_9ROSI|nr:hypothetical protein EZV62_011236 [Acer yangbiense]
MSIQGQPLEVTVVGCTKLKDTEWFSRQDPYVCLEYGSTKYRTRTCTDGGKNPKFQEKFVFPLIEGLRELNIIVWNSNTLTVDDFIGSGKVQLTKVLQQGFDDTAWPLWGKTGRFPIVSPTLKSFVCGVTMVVMQFLQSVFALLLMNTFFHCSPAGQVQVILHYANARQQSHGYHPSMPMSAGFPHQGLPPPATAPQSFMHVANHQVSSYPPPPPGGGYPPPPNPYGVPSPYPSHQPSVSAYPPQTSISGYPSQGGSLASYVQPYAPPPPVAYPPPPTGYGYPPPGGYPPTQHGSHYPQSNFLLHCLALTLTTHFYIKSKLYHALFYRSLPRSLSTATTILDEALPRPRLTIYYMKLLHDRGKRNRNSRLIEWPEKKIENPMLLFMCRYCGDALVCIKFRGFKDFDKYVFCLLHRELFICIILS